jgi:hypothetical protein
MNKLFINLFGGLFHLSLGLPVATRLKLTCESPERVFVQDAILLAVSFKIRLQILLVFGCFVAHGRTEPREAPRPHSLLVETSASLIPWALIPRQATQIVNMNLLDDDFVGSGTGLSSAVTVLLLISEEQTRRQDAQKNIKLSHPTPKTVIVPRFTLFHHQIPMWTSTNRTGYSYFDGRLPAGVSMPQKGKKAATPNSDQRLRFLGIDWAAKFSPIKSPFSENRLRVVIFAPAGTENAREIALFAPRTRSF